MSWAVNPTFNCASTTLNSACSLSFISYYIALNTLFVFHQTAKKLEIIR